MRILSIELAGFRTFESFEWTPSPGLNVLVGPGDSGKSTVLSAVELALAPRPVAAANDADFFRARFDDGFRIRVVVGDLTDEFYAGAGSTIPISSWADGALGPPGDPDSAVTVIEAEGTADFELLHWFVPYSGERRPCSVADRRRLFLSRLPAGDAARGELRLGRGSLLNRHMGEDELGGAVARAVRAASAELQLPQATADRVAAVRALLGHSGVFSEAALGLLAPEGRTLPNLVGLFDSSDFRTATPAAQYGQGTRRFALVALAAALVGDQPIITIDEAEHGLEPHRQRALVSAIRTLIGSGGQAFVTTHSDVVIGAAKPGEVHLFERGKRPALLEGGRVLRLLQDQPFAFLSPVPVLCEGPTETGLLSVLLSESATRRGKSSPDSLGIELIDGNGQPSVFQRATTLLDHKPMLGMFLDSEVSYSGSRGEFALKDCVAFFEWGDAVCVEHALASSIETGSITGLVDLAAELQDKDPSALLSQIVSRLDSVPASYSGDLAGLVDQVDEPALREALGKTMHASSWFKKPWRGRALASWLLEVDYPEAIRSAVDSFYDDLVSLTDGR